MENWRRSGYFSGSIIDRDTFLRDHPCFLLVQIEPYLATKEPLPVGNPLVEHFSHVPGFEVKPYARLEYQHVRDSIWMVCRRSWDGADAQTAEPHVPPG